MGVVVTYIDIDMGIDIDIYLRARVEEGGEVLQRGQELGVVQAAEDVHAPQDGLQGQGLLFL